MSHLNIEFKARCPNPGKIRDLLKADGAYFQGIDNQLDTYFPVHNGRLKLREGKIENALIYYERPEQAGPKESQVSLFWTFPGSPLKEILSKSLGILAVVEKQREIYFIDNVKFHIDTVKGLGSFIEVEAINNNGSITQLTLESQCRLYLAGFGITSDQLVSESYSDMILKRSQSG